MMSTVISQNIAARSERPPCDFFLFQPVHQGRGLLFSQRRQHPIDRAAYAQAGQFGETLAAFGAHAQVCRDLFNRRVALSWMTNVLFFGFYHVP